MMVFEGDRTFPGTPATIWAKLSDARFLVQCIPDATVKGTPDAKKAECTVRPGFAFVRGSLDVVLEVVEAAEPSSVKLLVTSKGIGSSSDVEASLELAGQDTATRAHWKAEVKRLGGLLKAVPSGLIRGAAQKVIDDVLSSVERQLAGTGQSS